MMVTFEYTPKYPRTLTKRERPFCDYLIDGCRLTPATAWAYVSLVRKLRSLCSDNELLSGSIDNVLITAMPEFQSFGSSSKCKYRKAIRLYRDYQEVQA